jgi:hypothetical protein
MTMLSGGRRRQALNFCVVAIIGGAGSLRSITSACTIRAREHAGIERPLRVQQIVKRTLHLNAATP